MGSSDHDAALSMLDIYKQMQTAEAVEGLDSLDVKGRYVVYNYNEKGFNGITTYDELKEFAKTYNVLLDANNKKSEEDTMEWPTAEYPRPDNCVLVKLEQGSVYADIIYYDITPSHAQALKLHELSKQGLLDNYVIEDIFNANKGNQNEQISFNKHNIESVIPIEYLKRDKRYLEQYIINAIKYYQENSKIENNKFKKNK